MRFRALITLAMLAGAPALSPAADLPIPRALLEDPPLPGAALDGWEGLTDSPPDAFLSREDAIALALAHNPELAAAREEAEVARWSAVQAGRLPNPSVEVEVFPFDEIVEVEGAVELDVTDAVLAPSRGRAARSAADAERHRAEETVARVTFEVTIAYDAAVAAKARLGVGQRALEALAAARDVAEARVASGNAPALELAAHAAAYERARGEVAALELAADAAREHLNALLGGRSDARVPDRLPLAPDAFALNPDAEALAVRASHTLAGGRARLDALAREARLARARGLPALSVALLGAWEREEEAEEWRAGVGLHTTLPVMDGGRAAGRAGDARLRAEQARVDGLVTEIGAQVRTTRARLATAHARVLHERDVVLPATRRVTRETLLHYNAMQLGVYELLRARGAELETELAHVETLRAFWAAKAEMDALLAGARVAGGGTTSPVSLGGASAEGGH